MHRAGHDTTALSTHLQSGCPAVRAGGYSQLSLGLAAARESAWTSACQHYNTAKKWGWEIQRFLGDHRETTAVGDGGGGAASETTPCG